MGGHNSKKGTKQVNPPTPKQRVESQFGNKAALVDAILGLIGEAPEGSRSKLMQTPNSKLLSHHHNTKRMVDGFGSRDGVIRAIVEAKYPKGAPEGYQQRLEGFTPWRLMDLHRQVAGK